MAKRMMERERANEMLKRVGFTHAEIGEVNESADAMGQKVQAAVLKGRDMSERHAKNADITWRKHEGEMNPPKLLDAEFLDLMGLPPDVLAGHPVKAWQFKVLDVWEEEWRKITGKDPRGSARHGPYIDYSQSDRPLVFDTPYENGQVTMTESTVVVSNPTATGPLGKDPGIVDKMISARDKCVWPDEQTEREAVDRVLRGCGFDDPAGQG